MHSPRTRRVQRIHLAKPLIARLGAAQVVLVDISILGARIEHHVPLTAGAHSNLYFKWDDDEIETACRIVRSRLERFSVGADGLTVYHSGLEFENMPAATKQRLKQMIARFITRALEEQKLNARGVMPQHDVDKMPIFRSGGLLTANRKDVKEAVGTAVMPAARVAKESGYVCYQLENSQWRRKRTHDPGQPLDGFTISAMEDIAQVELLCDAYLRSDREGRRLIQLFAQLSIMDDDGNAAQGRFEP
ncbi:MAG TPA: PilZ domain-containing protein [Thermoanaerobaculia bacterium]|nr:PilZ domain-containing protein [Thermoanaerobaculia bacterium]